jgi:starch phosphorylase
MGDDCSPAKAIRLWSDNLERRWSGLHIGEPTVGRTDGALRLSVPVFLGEISPDFVRVELFADEVDGKPAEVVVLHQEQTIPGAVNGFIYAGEIATGRDADAYTVRIIPYHADVFVPAELPLIAWQH